MKLFGKKCGIWLNGIAISEKQVMITYKMKELVLDNHPDYKYNYSSGDEYKKVRDTGKR